MHAAIAAENAFNSRHMTARPIDLVHLARQTLGDRGLEREILSLFERQSRSLAERIRLARNPSEGGDLAHTLKGSASAVGAWKVAETADCVEQFCRKGAAPEAGALAEMDGAVKDACAVIAAMDQPA